MISIETPKETLLKFDQNSKWKDNSLEVVAMDLLSASNESTLSLNPFFYEEKDGKLFDPNRKMYVSGTAGGDLVEEGVIKQIEDWFISNESGLAVWISPRGNGERSYPEEQITIYRIGYKFGSLEKILFLTSHQFNHEFKNPEELRKLIFTEDDNEKSVFEILNWLKSISSKSVQTELSGYKQRFEQAYYYAGLYKSGTPMEHLVYQMDQTRFLGENPIGCSGTDSSVSGVSSHETSTISKIDNHTETQIKYVRNCGYCGAVINAHISTGYVCPHCGGVYKGC